MSKETVRVLAIIVGAVIATAQGVQLYLADGPDVVTWQHLLAAGSAALVTWLAKSPLGAKS